MSYGAHCEGIVRPSCAEHRTRTRDLTPLRAHSCRSYLRRGRSVAKWRAEQGDQHMKQFIASLLIAFMATAAFADVASERDKTKKGAVIGGVAGAIAGAIIHNNRGSGNAKRGAVVGGVVGAATGAIVGAMMDKQERELRQIEGIDVARTDEDELKVTVRNEIQIG